MRIIKCKICKCIINTKANNALYCPDCRRETLKVLHKKSRLKNKDEIKERNKAKYIKNKEIILKKRKEYVTRNKEKVSLCNKEYVAKNIVKVTKRRKAYYNANKDMFYEHARISSKKARLNMSDFYIKYRLKRGGLNIPYNEIPIELVEFKREHIALKRLIKEIKNT